MFIISKLVYIQNEQIEENDKWLHELKEDTKNSLNELFNKSSTEPVRKNNLQKAIKQFKSIQQATKFTVSDEILVERIKNKKLYLLSPQWKEKRNIILKRDKHQCTVCHAEKQLEIHHITYKRLGSEYDRDLITLCRACHQAVHDKLGYPSCLYDYQNLKYKPTKE